MDRSIGRKPFHFSSPLLSSPCLALIIYPPSEHQVLHRPSSFTYDHRLIPTVLSPPQGGRAGKAVSLAWLAVELVPVKFFWHYSGLFLWPPICCLAFFSSRTLVHIVLGARRQEWNCILPSEGEIQVVESYRCPRDLPPRGKLPHFAQFLSKRSSGWVPFTPGIAWQIMTLTAEQRKST